MVLLNTFVPLLLLVSTASTSEFCGLIFKPEPQKPAQPVPLTSVSIHADVRGWTVGVEAELAYRNENQENSIECEFVFPLADTSAVYKLDAEIAERRLNSVLKDRKSAEKQYEEAVESGRKAALLESQQGSPDVYRLKIGNLPPNGSALIKIGYVQPIERILADGLLAVTLPVVLNPRYIPRHQLFNQEILDAKFHAKTPYVAVSEVRYTMHFDAKVSLGLSRTIADIKSRHENDTLQITFGEGKTSADVKLLGDFVQDHDFQLLITPSISLQNKPYVYLEPGLALQSSESSKTWLNYDVVAAWFEPPKPSGTSKISVDEYWLVVDRSGSMGGQKIADAKSALALFVKSLPFGCKFNVIGFGSTFTVLFDNGTVDYEDFAISKAIAHSREIEADLGGTEVLEALQYIYKQPLRKEPESRRYIILLTDGEVFNTAEVIELARKNAPATRIFSVGIGEGASTALVNGIARVSNGLSEFVRSATDRLQAKVITLLKATTDPSAESVEFVWQTLTTEDEAKITSIVPKKLDSTTVFAGGSVSQYAVIDRRFGLEKDVEGFSKFIAKIAGETVESRLDFQIAQNQHAEELDILPLHRLAAKKVLSELVDEFNANHSEDVRKEAVAISIATGVLCELTAFVAVDSEENVTANATKPILVRVERPTAYLKPGETFYGGYQFRSGFGGSPRKVWAQHHLTSPMLAMMPMSASFIPVPQKAGGHEFYEDEAAIDEVSESYSESAAASQPLHTVVAESAAATVAPKSGELMDLIMAQNFNGSWNLDDNFVKLLHVKKVSNAAELGKLFEQFEDLPADNVDTFEATVTALAVFRLHYATQRSEWQIIEEKALAYLSKSSNYSGDVDKLINSVASELE